MKYVDYTRVPVAVFPSAEQQAFFQASPSAFFGGRGTAFILPTSILGEITMPPALHYALPRSGLCISGYTSHMACLLEEIGGEHLLWWGWPEAAVALLAASIVHQHAEDDPCIRDVLHRLFGASSLRLEEREGAPSAFHSLALMVRKEPQELRMDQMLSWFSTEDPYASLN